MQVTEADYLAHYGILRRSGRYPWGSSSSANVRNKKFLDYVAEMRAKGLSETEIAKGIGIYAGEKISTGQLRAAKTIAKNQQKQQDINFAKRLKDKGYSNVAIGERMNLNESSVRALLLPDTQRKADILTTTTDMLREQVGQKKYLDVGRGVENHIGVSKEQLRAAVAILKEEGYDTYNIDVPQLGTPHETRVKVLVEPGVPFKDAAQNIDKLGQIASYSDDGGLSRYGLQPPLAVDPARVAVKYGSEGGTAADGVIYVRPGVEDVSLGESSYAQVRIQVGDSTYLKGMAMYGDPKDFGPGQDLIFNTNKEDTGNKLDSFKENRGIKETGKVDTDNPFGAQISRQLVKKNDDGTVTVTSAMNIVNEEGQWNTWSKNLSTQVLSKQDPRLARQQLEKTFNERQSEYDEIMSLTNPTVRKKLLGEFADGTDAAAVHMKAAALPRQRSQVILPIDSMPDTQIYAPNFRDGERVALIRYPHGGTFEIPELTVNNSHPQAKNMLGQAKDAVGINSRVAEHMSGADFDGDTVLVIPNGQGAKAGRIKSTPALDGLKGFDPKASYPAYEGMKKVSPKEMQIQMGKVSNLITDMTIRGASPQKIARAVRHSMVVIDSEKHNLDYKSSAIANGIPDLKREFQNGANSGATTIISRAGSETRIDTRKPRPAALGGPIDKKTGKKVYIDTGDEYTNKNGDVVKSKQKIKKLEYADDAFSLSSGTPVETVYAKHSNKLKALADKARKDYIETPRAKYNASAKKTYSKEVSSLDAKLNVALKNAPLERQAQVIANTVSKAKRKAYPDMDKTQRKREDAQALAEARARTGAKKLKVEITKDEWAAIQAGALSDSKVASILANADMDIVKGLATPKSMVLMSPARTARAQAMIARGATRSEVASALGVSPSTLDRTLDE